MSISGGIVYHNPILLGCNLSLTAPYYLGFFSLNKPLTPLSLEK